MKDGTAAVRQALKDAATVVVLTGAGISAESGIPTFRGRDGLWRNFSPQQLATPEAFARDPRLVWEWYDWRRGLISQAQPNAGHAALAELERRKTSGGAKPDGFTLVTQNVDGLHERAGNLAIARLHGDIWRVRCLDCGVEETNQQVPLAELPLRCACGGLMRPAVVWFGESLPSDAWSRAFEASRRAQVFLAVGTSGAVYPAAGLVFAARERAARIAVVNPEPTPLDAAADWTLRGPAGEILPRLL